MVTLELVEVDRVARRLQFTGNWSTAAIDRKDLILHAMRDEDRWSSLPVARYDESRREGQQVREQCAVDHTERQRVRRAVGEAAERNAIRIDGAAVEDILQRGIDVRAVVAEPPANGVPRHT